MVLPEVIAQFIKFKQQENLNKKGADALKPEVKKILETQEFDVIGLSYATKTEYVAERCAEHVEKLYEKKKISKDIYESLFKKTLDIQAFDQCLMLGKINIKDLPEDIKVTKVTERIDIDYKKL